jgi:hypothetical protein
MIAGIAVWDRIILPAASPPEDAYVKILREKEGVLT